MIEAEKVKKVELTVTAGDYVQRVTLTDGSTVERRMERQTTSSFRGTERAEVFEDNFSDDAIEALDNMHHAGADVSQWLWMGD